MGNAGSMESGGNIRVDGCRDLMGLDSWIKRTTLKILFTEWICSFIERFIRLMKKLRNVDIAREKFLLE